MNAQLRQPVRSLAPEALQVDPEVRQIRDEGPQLSGRDSVKTQFLVDLSDQGRCCGLASLDFASRKLPLQACATTRQAPGSQNPSPSTQDGRDGMNVGQHKGEACSTGG